METNSLADEARWRRFLISSGLFLAYEVLLITVFGDYFFTGVVSELGFWLMVAAAAAGYLLLGLCSGSWLSILVIWMPLAFVLALDPPVPADAWGSERLPLYGMWFYLTIIFLPAWGIGALASTLLPGGSASADSD